MNKDHWVPKSVITEEDEAAIRHMKKGEYKILHHREPPELVCKLENSWVGVPIHWDDQYMLKFAHDAINDLIQLACKKRDKKNIPIFEWKTVNEVFEKMDRIPQMIEVQLKKDEMFPPITERKQ
jgi:hypothetical protein